MEKKLMIYPFNKQICAVARYARLLKGFVLTAAVSPKNYGYDGKDVSFLDGGKSVGITITTSFQEGLLQCDSILFCSDTFSIDLNYYEERIREAASYKKEIWFTKELAEDFADAKRTLPADIKILGNNPVGQRFSYDESKHIMEISVPVLTILQVGTFCQGFETQLLLTEKFEQEGYRVSIVSSNTLGELFGIHMLPDYMYDHQISYEDKIVSFNRFLISLTEQEQPDILLLEIAEPILPYNDRITNHFGVIPAIITKAALADISILNLYYNTYDNTQLDHLRAYCRYALNAEINYINIADTSMIIKELDTFEPVQYISVTPEKVCHAISTDLKDYDCMFFHIHDENRTEAVYEDIVDRLSQNKDIVRIW